MPWYLDLPWWVWPSFTGVVAGGAYTFGGRCERVASTSLIVGAAASYLAIRHRYLDTEWILFAVDLSLFLAMTAHALRSPRYWPLALAGVQLLNVTLHIADALDPAVRPWAYATAQVIFSFIITGVLAVAVCQRAAERRHRLALAPA